ncbi:maleylpyruvate isomerase family mycothiol-dependent enzyme [Nonomuraea turcica]|uniref:maleylpyruvate isomerase family mycothiol-dependent enzyme n=1 Tax=Nonomuraea sp. G32 TaxID=3067274 RepID=UPI00273CD1B6|nr:maleylpyruvate isomerase family mycothiol-dependent enzyme [Nonomuraea sp. G32]MDP4506843.1 maleylpyruvate isomerase family mycothiol-dependent enzyme [Nonomuraea sp. G32]
MLDVERLEEGLREQTAGFARAATGGDPQAIVPTCPEWPLRVLVGHIGQAHRWTAELLRKGEPVSVPDPWQAEPGAPEGWEEWLRAGAEDLLDALRESGADMEMWTFLGPRPALFWLRRMLADTAVHHYDAAATTGAVFEIAGDLALDVVDEGMEMLVAPGAEQLKPDLVELRGRGERLGVRPRSGDGWVLIRTPEGLRCERGPVPAEADVVVSGAAADLMLVCSRRLPLGDARVEITGDRALMEHWLARMAF